MELSALYKNSKLYNIPANAKSIGSDVVILPESFNGVAVLYEYEQQQQLPEELEVFIGKVISGGMKLDPANTFTANLSFDNNLLRKVAEEGRAKATVVFGLKWLEGLHNPNIGKNDIVKLYGMKVLITDAPDVINTSDTAKKAFWLELKKIF